MRKFLAKVCLVFVICVTALSAYALTESAYAVVEPPKVPKGTGKVTLIRAANSDVFMAKVETVTDLGNCEGLGNQSSEFAMPISDAWGQAIYSMLLTAYTNQLDVTITGYTDQCYWGKRVLIQNVVVD